MSDSQVIWCAILLILILIVLMVLPLFISAHVEMANACRAAGYTDYIRWDRVAYCISIGETSDTITGMKYELVEGQ